MTKEQIIKMAREARCDIAWADSLERFAALVAAAEREACAKVCEDGINSEQYPTLTEIAAVIRARGETQ
jgi:predicted transcriptional regulator